MAAALAALLLVWLGRIKHTSFAGSSDALRHRQAEWADPSPHRVVRVAVQPGVELEVLD
jgi:hypothetical protein